MSPIFTFYAHMKTKLFCRIVVSVIFDDNENKLAFIVYFTLFQESSNRLTGLAHLDFIIILTKNYYSHFTNEEVRTQTR
jgi:hypothetical protein